MRWVVSCKVPSERAIQLYPDGTQALDANVKKRTASRAKAIVFSWAGVVQTAEVTEKLAVDRIATTGAESPD
jgi:hypothetical protein